MAPGKLMDTVKSACVFASHPLRMTVGQVAPLSDGSMYTNSQNTYKYQTKTSHINYKQYLYIIYLIFIFSSKVI